MINLRITETEEGEDIDVTGTKNTFNKIIKENYPFINRRNPNGQKTLKVMLNLLSIQGNAN